MVIAVVVLVAATAVIILMSILKTGGEKTICRQKHKS